MNRQRKAPPARTAGTEPEARYVSPEAFEAHVLGGATHFVISLFLGRGAYDSASTETPGAAVEIARKMKAAHPGNVRSPLIYAVNQDGRSVLVTGWTL